ncbi:Transcriptional regulator, LacI family [[Actinomadura] parvosata subsp. kistnae]|uniref:LacI family transcriptional regulator n=1 Tax=[Actinomadura] parvosata subsp. kistnae TaxID=1909395 RepID=A0A1U9ZV69_9ACTN|nr:substrate-binding domain-containing protein [Nonomuraea sp. ATCC 55076]AQZ61856.1 LacI family transcriptional regulator [Nonomuraea sp. ATCC 55076]SPL87999.1 Transcriptional regulator, LacI family [Actinomadura parvosata subsp. kistnae]
MGRRGRSERPTLADVARLAGVSPTTASKVLNGRSDVGAKTRDLVLGVMAEIGYKPTAARHEQPRERTLVTVLDIVESRYAGTVLQGILVAATAAQAELLLRLPPGEPVSTSPAVARGWMEEQRASGVVGLIALAVAMPDAMLLAAEELELPIVTIDPIDTTESRLVSIGSTNWAGGRSATEHVIRLGHRRIGWIGGPLGSAPSLERFHGYQAALDSAGITPDRALVRHEAFAVEAGQRHGRDLLSLPERPTAIVAGNDEIAVGVLAAAKELGIAVPGELSVTGFDDTPQAQWTTPRLTSVRQPLVGMGRMAVETVLGMADGVQPASRHLQLATTLSVRDSTGPGPHAPGNVST